MDAFRPHAIAIWQQLPLGERKKVFKWLLSPWNRHRHRMPGVLYTIAQDLMETGRLEMRKGRILSVESLGAQLSVKYLPPGSDQPEQLIAHQVINCTGPELHIERNSSLLLQNLQKRGFVSPHPTGIGLAGLPKGGIQGPIEDRFFALGPLRQGDLFEATAVPELREQCVQVCGELLKCKIGV